MSDKKIIAVVGATGAQGGGLVRAILADPNGPYVARAITRKANSDAAKALAKLGAEVVEANLNDEASMLRAFKNAYGVFLVTNFWVERTAKEEQVQTRAEMELAQAGIGARAAKAAGVQHVIWSTLEDTRKHFSLSDQRMPTLDGKYKVPHFDAKAEANAFFTRVGVPTTFLQTTFYYDAFMRGFGSTRDQDGKIVLTLPIADAKLAAIAAEDIGRTALGIFRRGDRFIGKTVSIAGEHLTGSDFAKAFSKAFGEEVAYRPYTHDQFRSFPVRFAIEIANTFQYYVEAADDFTGARDLKVVRELNRSSNRLRPGWRLTRTPSDRVRHECAQCTQQDREWHPLVAIRRVVHRTRGASHGPITRLVSPSDLGELIKPFVFLDHFDQQPSGGAGHVKVDVEIQGKALGLGCLTTHEPSSTVPLEEAARQPRSGSRSSGPRSTAGKAAIS